MTDAVTIQGAPVTGPEPARPLALRIAGIHLRNGALGLARAELEAAAGRGALDETALLDLAEVRWRTGDLGGAGEVANAYLATGRQHPLALVVAAEAVAALGRPGEARRLAGAALAQDGSSVDSIFAGMPRSLIWPAETPPSEDTAGTFDGGSASRPAATTAGVAGYGAAGSWGIGAGGAAAPAVLPDAQIALEAGRAAVRAGRIEDGATYLAIALRLDPALAPLVLDATGGDGAAMLDVVRGDAYRAMGHESEARAAFARALRERG